MWQLKISHKEAIQLIDNKYVTVDGCAAITKQKSNKYNKIICQEAILQNGVSTFYIAYNKPVGVECTQNNNIENNLNQHLNITEKYFPLGRLDKESEGLLILTNDGTIYNKVTRYEYSLEKEYIVKVNVKITEEAMQKMRNGINIMGQLTKPATVKFINENTFNIILMQGLNRQIRRMCYKLNLEVVSLQRIRIGGICLGNLKSNEYNYFSVKQLFL